jgi:alpha-galactosidase
MSEAPPATPSPTAPILTPPAPPAPRINGPAVFGVRPEHPVHYLIPATGERPMEFSASRLPSGLTIDRSTGIIRGVLTQPGDYPVVLRVRNAHGVAEKKFCFRCGEAIALTPPLGWNSWNCWGSSVNQDKVLRSARALVSSGLAQHGWSYVNIDDGWQGSRHGRDLALQANGKFPDLKAMCDAIHGLGLKTGIYSTPWITSYAGLTGGSSDDAAGAWEPLDGPENYRRNHRFGTHAFTTADAHQWAKWGFDYLKYDWSPLDVPHVAAMAAALRSSGRDIVYSLSNSASFAGAADWARLANCWRTTGDIWDYWDHSDFSWRHGVSEIGFMQDHWAPFAGPGHWNDPDMLVVGQVGWGPDQHPTHLTPDEQYSHLSLWCLLSAPLLIGCDLEKLDPFTLNLLTNDEVLALQYDSLGRQAVRVAALGAIDLFRKELEDGGTALGFFNRANRTESFRFNKFDRLGFAPRLRARDLWRQQDLPDITTEFAGEIPAHGVVLIKVAAE